jgi:tRNA (Thr-GGU) A37 N-methylase
MIACVPRHEEGGIASAVFATRLPERPNLIGVSTVKLLEVYRNELLVIGLDALNDSPVLDIKKRFNEKFTADSSTF